MRPNVVSLRQFYSSRLGRKIKQRLRQIVVQLWPDHGDEAILGIGYAVPVLRVLERAKPASLTALMPARQGAIYWPVHSANHSVLGDEMMPPFAPGTLHRVVMLHAFEHASQPLELLRVYWQMLAPGGRLLLFVPNRRGWWASYGHQPFARGTPYSMGHLRELLADAQFTLRDGFTTLYAPPSPAAFWMRLWRSCELIGPMLFRGTGGVLVVEAEKQIYASIPEPVAKTAGAKWAPAGAPVSAA